MTTVDRDVESMSERNEPRSLFWKVRLPSEARSAALIGGLILIAVFAAIAVLVTVVGDFEPTKIQTSNRMRGFGTDGHPLGTDQLGRDMLARAVAGLFWSVRVGITSACLVTLIGTAVGVGAATSEGVWRVLLTRFIDMSLSFPNLILAVTVMAIVGRGFWPLSLTLGLTGWPIFARVVYAEAIGLAKRDYVMAARLLGVGQARIILTHILPGMRNTLMVMWAFMFADLLIAESGLSFLGLGVPLGEPSLGSMLADGREYLVSSPHMVIVPGVTIALIVIAANLIGDGLSGRDPASAVEKR